MLDWCDEVGVQVVTLWLLSTDNARPRRLEPLFEIIENTVRRLQRRAAVIPMGASTCCPPPAQVMKEAGTTTERNPGLLVNVAVDTAGAARSPTRSARCSKRPRKAPRWRSWLTVDLDDIANTSPRQPDPDLLIRLRGAAALRLSAVAERPLGVLLLRSLLARVPQDRLSARRLTVCASGVSLLTACSPKGRPG